MHHTKLQDVYECSNLAIQRVYVLFYFLGVPVFSCTIYKYAKNKQDGYIEYSFEIYNVFSYFFLSNHDLITILITIVFQRRCSILCEVYAIYCFVNLMRKINLLKCTVYCLVSFLLVNNH